MKTQAEILASLDNIFEMKTEMCDKCDEKPCNCEDKGQKKGKEVEETNEMSSMKAEMDKMYAMKEMSHKDKYGKMKYEMDKMYDMDYEGDMKDEMAASAERMSKVYDKGVMEYKAKVDAMKMEMDKMYSMKEACDKKSMKEMDSDKSGVCKHCGK